LTAGELPDGVEPRAAARPILMFMQGALVLSKTNLAPGGCARRWSRPGDCCFSVERAPRTGRGTSRGLGELRPLRGTARLARSRLARGCGGRRIHSGPRHKPRAPGDATPTQPTRPDTEAVATGIDETVMIEKIFKAYDVRATYPNPLNEEAAWKVGHATGQFLKRSRQSIPENQRVRLEDTVVVGRDMRPSSPDLANALTDGLRSTGMNVVDVGMVDTSFIYFAINHLDCVGGVMTTASHNPVQYNGFKISGPKAKPIGAASGLDDIKRIATSLRVGNTGLSGKHEEMDLWGPYRQHVLQFLDLRRPLKVAVDASNGMAGKMVPKVFGDIDKLQIVPILFEITGSFVHEPNPLVESNLQMLKDKMAEEPCDLGACFDGDADRCMFLDERARAVGSDMITALLAQEFLSRPENKGSTIVYDLRSSHAVPDTIKAAGGVPRRDRVGHAFIKKTMSETKAVFGGELSGHLYFRDNFYADSAAVAFACVLTILGKHDAPFGELMASFQKYTQSGEINFQVEDKDAKIRELADAYKRGQIDYLDGITIDFGDWWFNVRKSNTEPLLRLNLETESPEMLRSKMAELKKILGEPAQGH
jgi:phosphomannomutase